MNAPHPRLASVNSLPQSTSEFLALGRRLALHLEIHMSVERNRHESEPGFGHSGAMPRRSAGSVLNVSPFERSHDLAQPL